MRKKEGGGSHGASIPRLSAREEVSISFPVPGKEERYQYHHLPWKGGRPSAYHYSYGEKKEAPESGVRPPVLAKTGKKNGSLFF